MKRDVSLGSPRAGHGAAPRSPALPTDLELYRNHAANLRAYTEALREGRCRRTNHFDARLGETVHVFAPFFSPWNMEILFVLYMRGAQRFNRVKAILAPISSRVLTDKLLSLARHGLLTRSARDRAVAYALTSRGEAVARHLHPLVFFLHNSAALE